MQATIEQLRLEGFPVKDEDLPHLWPTRYEHINVHGKVRFRLADRPRLGELRPLRVPKPASDLPPLP